MVYPYPSPGDKTNPYSYIVRRRLVTFQATDQAHADAQFMERYGYAPTEANQAS